MCCCPTACLVQTSRFRGCRAKRLYVHLSAEGRKFSNSSLAQCAITHLVRGTGPHQHKHVERTRAAISKTHRQHTHTTHTSPIADHLALSFTRLTALYLDYPFSQTSYKVMGLGCVKVLCFARFGSCLSVGLHRCHQTIKLFSDTRASTTIRWRT